MTRVNVAITDWSVQLLALQQTESAASASAAELSAIQVCLFFQRNLRNICLIFTQLCYIVPFRPVRPSVAY